MENLVGRYVGRYYMEAQLGEGGMATVYRAYDTRLERQVAIKVIRRTAFSQEMMDLMLKRFEREARAMAQISHASIVKVYDYGEYEGAPYLVMEYIPGGTFKNLTGKALHWQEAVRLVLPVARALSFAHQRKIIHRDIKPGNILISESGEPVLSDFGIAKVLEGAEGATLTGTGVGIGTPEYMAPEQGLGKDVDARADIYALGIVLYELMTGRRPFEADTPLAVVMKHITDPLPSPRQFGVELPEGVERVLVKALAKDRADRYVDMAAFTAALESLTTAVGERSTSSQAELGSLPTYQVETVRQATDRLAPQPEIAGRSIPTKTKSFQRGWLVLAGFGGLAGLVLVAVIGLLFWGRLSNLRQASGRATSAAAALLLQIKTKTAEAVAVREALVIPTSTFTVQPTITKAPEATIVPDPTEVNPDSLIAGEPTGKIVYTCQVFKNEKRNQICILNTDGSGFKQLTFGFDEADHSYPSFAPDGNSVVFTSNRDGSYNIYEMTLENYLVQLTRGENIANAPEISPDGRKIVLSRMVNNREGIWLMDRDGQNLHAVYAPDTVRAWDPVWSPDGSRILFASDRAGGVQLFIIDPDGNNIRQVSAMDKLRGRSAWAPGGNTIATYAGDMWYREIFLINLLDGSFKAITRDGNNLAPSFSPDGKWIVFTSYRDLWKNNDGCEIYIMRFDGSDIRRLTNNDYCDWQPRWGR